MALAAGDRLGRYRIESLLGAGGMGEVYKATDSTLERTVAIKVLPPDLASDATFRARFDREARTLSGLDHPHICAVYDAGEAPVSDRSAATLPATHYLVMQYLEGQTLATRMAKGRLSHREALTIAAEIADGLKEAHRARVVHRDLKPANIMLTRGGVKLLDFGLAKPAVATETAGLSGLSTAAPALTETGTIVGTIQYMAPEQLEGREADARSDIFAFGAVVYEMLTGTKAFAGTSRAGLIAAIMHGEPAPITSIDPTAPRAVARLVHKCLAKDRDERWQSAADLHESLRWAAEASGVSDAADPTDSGPRRHAAPRRVGAWAAAAILAAVGLGLLAATALRRGDPAPAPVYRTSVLAPAGVTNWTAAPNRFAISPDGTQLALVAAVADDRPRLFVRRLDSVTPQPLAGTEGAAGPFWSPDGRRIGFFAGGKIKTVAVSGGPAVTLADASLLPGGAWNDDDVILFTAVDLNGLSRVSATGGPVTQVTKLETAAGENAHLSPSFLPDGDHFLYFSRGSSNGAADVGGTYVGSLASPTFRQRIDVGPSARYAQGAIYFMRDSSLMAQPFDATQMAISGEPVAVGEQVDLGGSTGRAGAFAVSETGIVAYQTGPDVRSQLVWFDRSGRELSTLGEPADEMDVSLSPDGTKAVVSLADPVAGPRDLWMYELARGLRTRLTFDPGDEVRGTWTPDGSRIIFGSGRAGKFVLAHIASSGGTSQETLTPVRTFALPTDVSPDGRSVLYADGTPQRDLSFDEWLLPLDGPRQPTPFAQTPFNESGGRFSPDGRWLAYQSNESGRVELYVTAFPQGGRKWQVSTSGGAFPRWRRDGGEIFYISPGRGVMAARVDGSRDTFDVGATARLFSVRFRAGGYLGYYGDGNYDVSADGQRILVNVGNGETLPGPITILQNWRLAAER